MLGIDYLWVLLFLPLALLPFILRVESDLNYSSLDLLPVDPLSRAIEFFLRLLASLVIVFILLGVSG